MVAHVHCICKKTIRMQITTIYVTERYGARMEMIADLYSGSFVLTDYCFIQRKIVFTAKGINEEAAP